MKTTLKMPIFALIAWILLAGIKIISLLRSCGSLFNQILGAVEVPGVYLLVAIFNAASILLLLCNIGAIIGVIVSLFRKKCGKLLVASLAVLLAVVLLFSLLNFFKIFLQDDLLNATTAILNWSSVPTDVLALLLLILFTIGVFFPKNKFLRFCSTKLFFLPCLFSVGSGVVSTIAGFSNLISLLSVYKQANIPLSFTLLCAPICNLLITCTANLLVPIAFLTLALFIRKAVKCRFEELTCPAIEQ